MIKSILVMHILIFLILACHSRQGVLVTASLYSEQNGVSNINPDSLIKQHQSDTVSATESDQQQQQQQQQQRVSDSLPQENLKRFVLKGLNLDGYTIKPSIEQWRMVRLNQLLDSLSSAIPAAPSSQTSSTLSPIYRGGRTFPSFGLSVANSDSSAKRELNDRFGEQQVLITRPQALLTKQPIIEYEPADAAAQAGGLKKNILGITWPQSRPTGSFYNARRSQYNSRPHLILGTEETALHTPKHSRSVNDYEWKRVENSRWNNLRGMWGKRASNGLDQEEDEISSEEDLNRRSAGDE